MPAPASPQVAPAPSGGAAPAAPVIGGGHPMDSSRILLSMTELARRAAESRQEVAASGKADDVSTIIAPAVLKTLLSAINYRDAEVLAHSRRVAKLAVGMAQHLGWEGRALLVLEIGSLLHDVGKIGVADNVLHKPGKLSPAEFDYVQTHENIASNLLQALRVDPTVVELIQQSHGDFNAAQSAGRRSRQEVHQGARVLKVADAYDSLIHAQSYRAAMSHEQAMRILNEGSGSRFDGNVVSALDGWVGVEGVDFLTGTADARIAANLHNAPGLGGLSSASVAAQDAGSLCQIISYLYVLETLYDGFYVLDSDLKCVIWSPGAEKLTGRTAKRMVGQSYSRGLYAQADPQATPLTEGECPVRQATATGHSALRTLKVGCVDEEPHTIELQSIPLMDGGGRMQGIAQILRNTNPEAGQDGQYKALQAAARRDALTGVANRGELERQMKELVGAHREAVLNDRQPQPMTVVFTDIDRFKSINDTHGHGVGDQVLKTFAKALQKEIFSGELVARYGGEEFVLVCPCTAMSSMVERTERIRQSISKLQFEEVPGLTVTSSFGVAELAAGEDVEGVFHRADAALMTAKQTGRNRVCQAESAKPVVDETPAERVPSAKEWTDTMEVCTQSNLIVIKLRGFVADMGADLRKAEDHCVIMRLGGVGMLRRWGSTPDKQGVELRLDIGTDREARGAAKYVPVVLTMRPLGKPKSPYQFEDRCKMIARDLKGYLVGR